MKLTLKINEIINEKMCLKKGGSFSYRGYRKKAVVTVEAAVVIPLFLMAIMTLISFVNIIKNDMRIKQALYEESRAAALWAVYDSEYNQDVIEQHIKERLGEVFLNSPYVDNQRGGVSFDISNLTNPEIIEITVHYYPCIPFDIFGLFDIRLTEKIIFHSWTGYVNGLNNRGNAIMVYVTENSNVYHRNRDCSHIRLNISEIDRSDLETIRNSNGSKYKKCLLCRGINDTSILYVTSDGDRYHTTLSCSGLKRNVRTIPLFQTGDRRPCLRCGY